MSDPMSAPAASGLPQVQKRRGLLRGLFRTPLGLAALVLGGLGLLIALAPTLASGLGGKLASDWFSKRYHGRLTIGALDLGWSGPQRIDDVELLDPSGTRVARMSARLPGLWSLVTSGGTRLGRIEIQGEANLSADASGRTNLDDALEPREKSVDAPVEPDDESSDSKARRIEAELELSISRITWADERTRELGAPFVLENVTLAAVMKPDLPLTARLHGTLSGSTQGELDFDARIEHPFEAPSSATPPRAAITASVAHLPTALVDAIARQGGRLESLLGEELSLELDAKGTLEEGSFELRLDAPRGRVRGSARIAEGVLRSENEGFALDLELGKAFIDSAILPMLPGGATLVVAPLADADGKLPGSSARFAVNSFEAPLGAYLEASAGGRADDALDQLCEGIRASWSAQLGECTLAGSSALAGRGPLTLRGLTVVGELNAPEEDSRLQIEFSASNPSKVYGESESHGAEAQADMAFGQAKWVLRFPGGAGLARYSPDRDLLPLRANIRMQGVPTALFDSVANTGGDLMRMLGARLGLDVDLEASVAAAPAPGLGWAQIGARWRELAARASALATVQVHGTPTGEKIGRFGGEICSVRGANLSLKLAPAQPLEVRARLDFESTAPGHFELQASLADVFADPATQAPLRFALASSASGLPTKIAGELSGQGERIQQLLGRYVAIEAAVQGTLDEGTARINLSTESAQLLLVGRLQGGMFVNMDEPLLRVSLQPDARLFDALVAPHLPEGTRLAFAESRGVVGLDVNFLALPVKELIEAAKQSGEGALALALAKTRCDAVLGLREFEYQDATLLAAGERVDKLAVQLELELIPGDQATKLSLDAHFVSPAFGDQPLDLHFEAPHAPSLLAIHQGGSFAPVTVSVSGHGLPTALLDAFAGGVLREALGPKLDLNLGAQLSQAKGAPFAVDAKLELAAAGGKSTLSVSARVDDPFNKPADPSKARPAGVLPQLEASLDVSGAGALLAFAPASARAPLRELCGETIAARVKLAESAPGAARADLALDAGGLELAGAFDYTDRLLSTLAAQPLVLSVTPSQATLDGLLAGQLPAGAGLKLAQPGTALIVKLTGLRAPLAKFFDADPSLARAELVENLELTLDATLPAFEYTHPGAPAAAPGGAATPPAVVLLRDIQLKARMQPGAPANVDLTGTVEATPPGALEAHIAIEKPAGFLAEAPAPFPAPGSHATLVAKLSRFPSALLDVIARQDGLLLDVLGPELEANVRGVYPDSKGEPLHAELHSSFGDIVLTSRMSEGLIVSQGEQGLDAKVGLTPLFSERIIGALIPIMVQVRQDDPAKRTLLKGRNLALPLDGELSKLSGDIDLNLGAVEYQLLPGLAQGLSLGSLELPTSKSTVIKPISIKITNGIAHYDSIPIRIGDREVSFRGNANLAKRTFELAFSVPLEMLGSKVEAKLEPLRKVLDPKLEVPLELHGSWKSPKLRLGKGFLEKVLKDAAEGALKGELEKGLGELLGGGKKKKKDG